MARYSIVPREWIFLNGYGFLSGFHMSKNYVLHSQHGQNSGTHF